MKSFLVRKCKNGKCFSTLILICCSILRPSNTLNSLRTCPQLGCRNVGVRSPLDVFGPEKDKPSVPMRMQKLQTKLKGRCIIRLFVEVSGWNGTLTGIATLCTHSSDKRQSTAAGATVKTTRIGQRHLAASLAFSPPLAPTVHEREQTDW
jgi:hypothetical protein